ncbi:hypothetical protein BpHYR1_046406 [Brachionus plicatilis]|uniref:Uncharacterized protein n=1 Tax=Brachionus plicatilis TaxID=10195 RepID=A0A3M7RHE0_BRAPC|nr:hypothetical protein BpHYR1_046406 [Brachionus plicatilis]
MWIRNRLTKANNFEVAVNKLIFLTLYCYRYNTYPIMKQRINMTNWRMRKIAGISVNLVDIINDNYTNSKNEFFNVLFFFSATWLPDSSTLLCDKIRSFYQIKKKNFDNLELIFFSSDKSFSEYKSFMENNSFIRYTLDFLDQNTKCE